MFHIVINTLRGEFLTKIFLTAEKLKLLHDVLCCVQLFPSIYSFAVDSAREIKLLGR